MIAGEANAEVVANADGHDRRAMFELHESRPPRAVLGKIIGRLPTIGVAALFVIVGYTKFNDDPNGEWFRIFELIGIGHWFRYATGTIQIAGGVLMLFPRSLTAGAAMLACTMIGAALVDVFILGSPLVLVPLVLLFVLAVTWVTSE